jgi:hypothetical protein
MLQGKTARAGTSGLTASVDLGANSGMRTFFAAVLASGLALTLPGCPTCPARPAVTEDAGRPTASFSCCAAADRAPVPPTAPRPPRFIVSAWAGSDSLLTLLDPGLEAIGFDVAGGTTSSWIARRSRWPNMRGTGIGVMPLLTRGLSPVPGIVTIWGDTSLITLGLPTGQEDWEWVVPPTDEGTRPPVVDTLVVPDVLPVDGGPLHDLAFVARDRIAHGSTPFGMSGNVGGDIVVLDVESNLPTVLGPVDLSDIADTGLSVRPTMLAYADGLLYAALDHGIVVGPMDSAIRRYGDGLLAVIDARTRVVRFVVRFPGLTNCTQVVTELPARTECGPGVVSYCDGSTVVACNADGTAGTRTDCVSTPDVPSFCQEGLLECRTTRSREEQRLVVACSGTPDRADERPTDGGIVVLTRDPDGLAAPAIERTMTAPSLSIPSPSHGLTSLSAPVVSFVSTGSVSEGTSDRLYMLNVDTQRADLLETVTADAPGAPAGFGDGAYDPVADADGNTLFVVPAARLGLFAWSVSLGTDPMDRSQLHVIENEIRPDWDPCGGLPARVIRLIP